MAEQKEKLLTEALKAIKQLRHLTGNNEKVAEIQFKIEGLKEVL
jgi:uncharacterized protein with WD repeat